MFRRTRKSFVSKDLSWDIKRIRCGFCARWLSEYDWDTFPEDTVAVCSGQCELAFDNAEEEDIVY
jgi:hypothetical protein